MADPRCTDRHTNTSGPRSSTQGARRWPYPRSRSLRRRCAPASDQPVVACYVHLQAKHDMLGRAAGPAASAALAGCSAASPCPLRFRQLNRHVLTCSTVCSREPPCPLPAEAGPPHGLVCLTRAPLALQRPHAGRVCKCNVFCGARGWSRQAPRQRRSLRPVPPCLPLPHICPTSSPAPALLVFLRKGRWFGRNAALWAFVSPRSPAVAPPDAPADFPLPLPLSPCATERVTTAGVQ